MKLVFVAFLLLSLILMSLGSFAVGSACLFVSVVLAVIDFYNVVLRSDFHTKKSEPDLDF